MGTYQSFNAQIQVQSGSVLFDSLVIPGIPSTSLVGAPFNKPLLVFTPNSTGQYYTSIYTETLGSTSGASYVTFTFDIPCTLSSGNNGIVNVDIKYEIPHLVSKKGRDPDYVYVYETKPISFKVNSVSATIVSSTGQTTTVQSTSFTTSQGILSLGTGALIPASDVRVSSPSVKSITVIVDPVVINLG